MSTAEHTHAFATYLALTHGKHVFCEKPLTYNIWEARLIRETAAKYPKLSTQMGNQGHASAARRTIKEILMTGVIGPVREVHVWADRAWGLQDAASAEKFDKPHGFYNGIQIVDRFKEEMPIPPSNHFDLWLGPAPARPFHATYFPGPRWYRWWDFGNGTMSDLGSHDNDVPYTVLDIRQPLTIEAKSPNGPVAHKELAPATMTVTYEFAASPSGAPPVKLVWHQGDSKPPGWVPAWGGRSQLFIGDKGMLLGNGKLLPEEKFKDFQTPPETLPRSPGHWVEWVNYAKGTGPVPGLELPVRRLDDRSESPWQRRLPDREEDRMGLQEPARQERAGSGAVHQATGVPQGLGRHSEILRRLSAFGSWQGAKRYAPVTCGRTRATTSRALSRAITASFSR